MTTKNILIVAGVALGLFWLFRKKTDTETPSVTVPRGSRITILGEGMSNIQAVSPRATALGYITESGFISRT